MKIQETPSGLKAVVITSREADTDSYPDLRAADLAEVVGQFPCREPRGHRRVLRHDDRREARSVFNEHHVRVQPRDEGQEENSQ